MEIYTNENKKTNTIKRFFINNSKELLIALIIGIGAIIIWNYWKLDQENTLQKNAQSFEQISSQFQTGSKQTLINAERFANETNNIYGVLTNIELAKILVEKNDIINAEKKLLNALSIARLKNLKNLINVRLARVQLALNKTDQVLISLTKVESNRWSTIIENIRGDVLLKKGDIVGARRAYLKGIESNGSETMKTILKFKINSLPS
ncbi:MAG: YfgM family protein [Arsenophonus sp.]